MYKKYLYPDEGEEGREKQTHYLKGAAFYATLLETAARGSAIVPCTWGHIRRNP